MARSAAAMYGGAAFLAITQTLTVEGPNSPLAPGLVALVIAAGLLLAGARLPGPVLASLGPLGAAMIGIAVATSPGPSDAALLYIWPVVWTAYFFGRTGTIAIVVWIGVVDAVALIALPAASSYLDRWLDVVVPIGVVAAVVHALAVRNEQLLAAAEADARMDGLTGLLNRRGFNERASEEISRARREDSTITVVAFDIDHFKHVNDALGHDAGDTVLASLGEAFRETSREGDVVARVGGEEFTAVLRAVDREQAMGYAERVRRAFAARDFGIGPLTISAGVACAPAVELDFERLTREADAALYAAKEAGRDRVVIAGEPQAALLAR